MSRLRESQAGQPPSGSRQTVLYAAVGGTMILIVALWVVVMPMQLAKLNPDGSFNGLRGAVRSATGASDPAAEWDEAMQAAANDLKRAAARADAEEEASSPAVGTESGSAVTPQPLDAETLTNRLEAAAPDAQAAAPPSQNQ